MTLLLLLACGADKGGGPLDTGTVTDTSTGGGGTVVDADGDGYPVGEDCDDETATVYPGARETCWDGVDQDCDGVDLACEGVSSASWGAGSVVGHESPVWDKTKGWVGGPFTLAVGWELTKVDGWLPDGAPAVVLGAPATSETSAVPWTDWEGNGQGAFFVVDPRRFHGRKELDGVYERRVGHDTQAAHLGTSMDARDMDADGVDELVVLADAGDHHDGDLGVQEVWLLSGMPSADGFIADVAEGRLVWDKSGTSISQVRLTDDLTGDGRPDLAVGIVDGNVDDAHGGILIVNGQNMASRQLGDGDIFLGVERHATKTRGVASGDVDGDGITDLALAAQVGGGASANAGPGEVIVFFGPFDQDRWDADADARVIGEYVRAGYFGYSLIASKDFDEDGRVELLACAKFVDSGTDGQGRAYVMPGESLSGVVDVLDVTSLRIDKRGEQDDDMGWGIQDGGDLDADGHRELIVVSGKLYEGKKEDQGVTRMSVFQGPLPTGAVQPQDARVEVMSDSNEWLGHNFSWQSMSTGVDLNGDGFDDWMAGGASSGTYGEGVAYLWYGAAW